MANEKFVFKVVLENGWWKVESTPKAEIELGQVYIDLQSEHPMAWKMHGEQVEGVLVNARLMEKLKQTGNVDLLMGWRNGMRDVLAMIKMNKGKVVYPSDVPAITIGAGSVTAEDYSRDSIGSIGWLKDEIRIQLAHGNTKSASTLSLHKAIEQRLGDHPFTITLDTVFEYCRQMRDDGVLVEVVPEASIARWRLA